MSEHFERPWTGTALFNGISAWLWLDLEKVCAALAHKSSIRSWSVPVPLPIPVPGLWMLWSCILLCWKGPILWAPPHEAICCWPLLPFLDAEEACRVEVLLAQPHELSSVCAIWTHLLQASLVLYRIAQFGLQELQCGCTCTLHWKKHR